MCCMTPAMLRTIYYNTCHSVAKMYHPVTIIHGNGGDSNGVDKLTIFARLLCHKFIYYHPHAFSNIVFSTVFSHIFLMKIIIPRNMINAGYGGDRLRLKNHIVSYKLRFFTKTHGHTSCWIFHQETATAAPSGEYKFLPLTKSAILLQGGKTSVTELTKTCGTALPITFSYKCKFS